MQPPDVEDGSLPCTLILVGASIRAAAQSARRGGFSVLGADFFGDLDTLDACDRHKCLAPNQQNEPLTKHFLNSTIKTNPPIIRVGGLGNCRLADEPGTLGPSFTTLQELKNPAVLGRIALESGLRVPKTILDDTALASATVSGRWMRKAKHSSGGTGVTWHERHSLRSRNATRGDDSVPPDSILQQWIPGRSYGATFFVTSDSVSLLGIFRSLFVRRGQHPFLYAGSFGPIPLSHASKKVTNLASLKPSLQRFGTIAADQFQLKGIYNVDFIVDEVGNGWVLEINPRWTAASELIERRLIELQTLKRTDSLMRWHLLANLEHSARLEQSGWERQPKTEEAVACETRDPETTWFKQVIYADRPGTLDVRSLQAVTHSLSIEFADLPPPTRVHHRGDPLVTMIGKLGPTGCPTADKSRMTVPRAIQPLRPSQWRQAIRQTLQMIQS